MRPAEPDTRKLSRRSLLGAGLGRAFDAQVAAMEAARGLDRRRFDPGRRQPPPAAGWREGSRSAATLGRRLELAARRLLEACGGTTGMRVLDVSAGDGMLAELAARAGARVVAVEPDPALRKRGRENCAAAALEVEWRGQAPAEPDGNGSFDAVLSCFGASHHADQRAMASELIGAARSGAPIALTAWTGLMAGVMAAAAPARRGRSERWSRHDTARLHFFDFPDLAVTRHSLQWRFDDDHHAAVELAGPTLGGPGERRLREVLPELIAAYGERREGGIVLRSDYTLVFARKP